MKRIGVFVDVSDVYHALQAKYSRKLNYEAVLAYVRELGEIQQAFAYGAQIGNHADKFIHCLTQIGFTPKYKAPKAQGKIKRRSANWDIGLTVDIFKMIDRLDMVVLGTSDGDFEPLVQFLRERGIDVLVLGCRISRELQNAATRAVEIPQSMLEEKKPDAEPKREDPPVENAEGPPSVSPILSSDAVAGDAPASD